jgi:hypothetical protein
MSQQIYRFKNIPYKHCEEEEYWSTKTKKCSKIKKKCKESHYRNPHTSRCKHLKNFTTEEIQFYNKLYPNHIINKVSNSRSSTRSKKSTRSKSSTSSKSKSKVKSVKSVPKPSKSKSKVKSVKSVKPPSKSKSKVKSAPKPSKSKSKVKSKKVTESKNNTENKYDQKDCPVCYDPLTKKNTETLECGHAMCKSCLGTMLKSRHRRCGLCRKRVTKIMKNGKMLSYKN